MDRNKLEERDVKTVKTFNIVEDHSFLDARYSVIISASFNIIGDTGLLIVGRIDPIDITVVSMPKFVLRWDDKAQTLDIDAETINSAEKTLFKKGTAKYFGHHPKLISNEIRKFEVQLIWNGEMIYQGTISFNTEIDARANDTIRIKDECSVVFHKNE